MHRRKLLRRLGAASAVAAGGAGIASAEGPTHVSWGFEDGREEVIPIEEFERRPDTPSLEEIGRNSHEDPCCCCVDSEPCTRCIVCMCP